MANVTARPDMSREELNAIAATLGIQGVDSLPNKEAVIQAIQEAPDAIVANPGTTEVGVVATGDTAQPLTPDPVPVESSAPGVYIVNGIKVDPNGVPVKGN